jgi:outer membrane protein assembly factor BamE (lipoprotein component of BamABCDE complex)
MNPLSPHRRRALLSLAAVSLLAAAAAHGAAAPRSSDPTVQAQVKRGMTMDEVTQLLGKPQRTRKYGRGEATWGYATKRSDTWFLVDFGPDGKVKSVTEKYVPAF